MDAKYDVTVDISHFFYDMNLVKRYGVNSARNTLRSIALGRKNFLFVGHQEAGENLAILQTLVSTCNYLRINPQEYLSDVLIRIQTHPASEIDDLLPDRWQPPDRSPD